MQMSEVFTPSGAGCQKWYLPASCPLAATSSQLLQEAVQQLEVCFAAPRFLRGDRRGKQSPPCSAFGMAALKEEEVK